MYAVQFVVRDADGRPIAADQRPVIALSAIQDALDAVTVFNGRYTVAAIEDSPPLFRLDAVLRIALKHPVLIADRAAFEEAVANIVKAQTGECFVVFQIYNISLNCALGIITFIASIYPGTISE